MNLQQLTIGDGLLVLILGGVVHGIWILATMRTEVRNVIATLKNHEVRISRLEKGRGLSREGA